MDHNCRAVCVHADLSIIRDYMSQDNVDHSVMVNQFQNGRKNLYFINAQHVSGIYNATCDTIRVID